jgi:hypothetical protein
MQFITKPVPPEPAARPESAADVEHDMMKHRNSWISAALLAALAGAAASCGGSDATVEAQAKPEPLSIEATKISAPSIDTSG